jgi:hypothetical protein
VFVVSGKGPKHYFARVFRFMDHEFFDILAQLRDVGEKRPREQMSCGRCGVREKGIKINDRSSSRQPQNLGIENVVMTRSVQESQVHGSVVRTKRVRLDRDRATTIMAIVAGSTVDVFDADRNTRRFGQS